MAVYGGQVQAINMAPDTRQSVAAARELAMTGAQGIAGMVGQVGDYFKQQGEKKKLIKKSDVQIDAALKLFPDLAPSLQGYRDQIRDENVPLDDRAAIADSVAGLINMGVNQMRSQAEQGMQQQRAMMEQQYKAVQLGLEAEKVDIDRQKASQGPTPKFELRKPQITSPTGEVFEGPELPYDESRGMYFDPKVKKYIADPNLIGTGKEYAPDSAMPTPTSQVGGGTADLIASAAQMNIGKLSTAKTPGTQGGNLGCADAICRTFKQATGEELVPGGTLSTREMATTLENDPRFVKVPLTEAQKGDIVLTPRKGSKAGHTGIVLDDGAIASNSSKGFAGGAPGTFGRTHTINSWRKNVEPRNPSETAAYRYVKAQGIDNALETGGDMTQQAMGTPEQQAEVARMIEEGQGMAKTQNIPQGAIPTDPSMTTQQPQLPQQAAPQWTPPSGFAPVKPQGKQKEAKIITGEEAKALNLDPLGTYEALYQDGQLTGVQTLKASPSVGDVIAMEKRAEEKVAKQELNESVKAKSMRMVSLMTELRNHPGFSGLFGVGFTGIPGTDSANAKVLYDQIQAQGFMEAIKDMKGMGALSNAEGEKASSAFVGINPSMSEEAALARIDEVIGYIKEGKKRIQSGKLIETKANKDPSISGANSYFNKFTQTPAR